MPYKVPFVNYSLQYHNLEKEMDATIKDVLNRGDLILRKDVEEFEKNLADFVGTKYAIGVGSGTDALILSLKAAGIGPGDEVITVSHTFVASIASIVYVGATPVLIDVAEDFDMDTEKLEEAITPKTKAIMPVHLNGRICDMEKIMDIAKRHNLTVIEDAAQALGAKFNNKTAGSFGLTGCFSFYPAKLLGAYGDAGGVTTNNEKIAEKVRLLRNHGQKKNEKNIIEVLFYGETARLDNLQAAVLNVKFKRLSDWIKRRREIAQNYSGKADISGKARYNQGLAGIAGIKLPPAPNSDSRYFDIYQNYVLKAEKRNELFEFLKEKGVETLIKDPIANHFHPGLNLSHFKLPYTEELANKVISLPMYPELTDEQVEYVISCAREFYR